MHWMIKREDEMKFPLEINDETRLVEVRDVWGDGKAFDTVKPVGAWQKRSGKQWASIVRFWQQPDGSYKPDTWTVRLNRQGYRLVGWADQIAQQQESQHNSACHVKRT
jgi:hypothetical protein